MKKLYMILPLALILCFIVGCEHRAALVELEKFQAQADVEEQNIALVKRIFEEVTNKNDEIFQEALASEYGWYVPSNNPKPLSREQEGFLTKALWEALPDFTHEIVEIMGAGDKVIVRANIKFTHTSEWMGVPATGNKVKVSAIYIYSIKDGKAVEMREELDMLGLYQQLGMELKPKEGEK